MAEYRVRAQVKVDYKDVVKNLNAVGLGIRSPNLRARVVIDLLAWIQKNFRQEGALVGGWPELSKSYEKYKNKYRPGAPILVWDGKLKHSFEKKSSMPGRPVSGDTRIIIGTDVKYAKYHEQTQYLGSMMPHRKMLPPKDVAEQISKKAVETYVKSIVKDYNAKN